MGERKRGREGDCSFACRAWDTATRYSVNNLIVLSDWPWRFISRFVLRSFITAFAVYEFRSAVQGGDILPGFVL